MKEPRHHFAPARASRLAPPHGRLAVTLTAALVMVLGVACDKGRDAPDAPSAQRPRTLQVYTTFYPTEWMAARIGGAQVEVHNPVSPEADPITWVPDDATLASYQGADLIVLNGAGFERWVQQASLPRARTVDTAAAFADQHLTYAEATTHTHGGAEHSHEGLDGHTWVDPLNAIAQARAIGSAMTAADPDHADDYRGRLEALEADLTALHKRMEAITRRLGGAPLVASHPAYNYVARRHGWNLRSLDLDPADAPSASQLRNLKEHLAQHPARIMLWEAEPSPQARAPIEALGLKTVTFSPVESLDAAQRKAGMDYLGLMNANLDRLEAALEP